MPPTTYHELNYTIKTFEDGNRNNLAVSRENFHSTNFGKNNSTSQKANKCSAFYFISFAHTVLKPVCYLRMFAISLTVTLTIITQFGGKSLTEYK